jgi:hypothetical protein
MFDDDFGYEFDEGSDIDNWEAEQVFRDYIAEKNEEDTPEPEFEGRKCSCGQPAYEQYDAYNIYAGFHCDECFEKKFRTDRYFDPGYAGESLEEDW